MKKRLVLIMSGLLLATSACSVSEPRSTAATGVHPAFGINQGGFTPVTMGVYTLVYPWVKIEGALKEVIGGVVDKLPRAVISDGTDGKINAATYRLPTVRVDSQTHGSPSELSRLGMASRDELAKSPEKSLFTIFYIPTNLKFQTILSTIGATIIDSKKVVGPFLPGPDGKKPETTLYEFKWRDGRTILALVVRIDNQDSMIFQYEGRSGPAADSAMRLWAAG